MKDKVIDFNAIGQVMDTSWGRSSTTSGTGQSVKFKFIGETQIEACFSAIINLVSERDSFELRKRYTSEANETIEIATKRVKENYKETTESTLKLKQVSDSDTIEIIDLNIYSGKKTALFRRKIVFEMS